MQKFMCTFCRIRKTAGTAGRRRSIGPPIPQHQHLLKEAGQFLQKRLGQSAEGTTPDRLYHSNAFTGNIRAGQKQWAAVINPSTAGRQERVNNNDGGKTEDFTGQ